MKKCTNSQQHGRRLLWERRTTLAWMKRETHRQAPRQVLVLTAALSRSRPFSTRAVLWHRWSSRRSLAGWRQLLGTYSRLRLSRKSHMTRSHLSSAARLLRTIAKLLTDISQPARTQSNTTWTCWQRRDVCSSDQVGSDVRYTAFSAGLFIGIQKTQASRPYYSFLLTICSNVCLHSNAHKKALLIICIHHIILPYRIILPYAASRTAVLQCGTVCPQPCAKTCHWLHLRQNW